MLINVNSYRTWCDYEFDGRLHPYEGNVIWCNPEDIHKLFKLLEPHPDYKVIVVSAGSDYSIRLQKEHPVNADILKMAERINWQAILAAKDYINVSIPAANYKDCNITDEYSIKIDAYTIATFNKIPQNVVTWFCANADFFHPVLQFIPYGANIDTESNGILKYYKKPEDKTKLVYVNFRLNSSYRKTLLDFFQHYKYDFMTLRTESIDVDTYYQELSEHKYAIVPEGNGIDSYRFIESLAVGTVPIVMSSRWAYNAYVAGFPIAPIHNLHLFNEETFKITEEHKLHDKLNGDLLTEEYWRGKILGAKKLLEANNV